MVIKACSYRNFWAEIPLAILWQNWQFSVANFSRYSIKNFRYYMENECHEISKFCIKYSTILCTNSEFLCFLFSVCYNLLASDDSQLWINFDFAMKKIFSFIRNDLTYLKRPTINFCSKKKKT